MTVRLASDPSVTATIECAVWGDRVTPAQDPDGHFIVDDRVSDWVEVPVPSHHPTVKGAPLPAGLYELFVEVPNVTNVVYDSSVPPTLRSNTLLLRIEADSNVTYLLWNDGGRCNRETSGLGSDEIWWDAFTGHLVASDVPVPSTGTSGLTLKATERRPFPRTPWNDMDDGESTAAYTFDLWGPAPFDLNGVAVIGLVGFEVDAESAARDQLQGFGNAWGEALGAVVGAALGVEGTATGLAGLAVKAGLITAKLAFTVAVAAAAVIAAVVIIATAFWAAWAPADLIALDVFHLDASSAWDRTDPKRPMPPVEGRQFGDPNGDENLVTVTQTPVEKVFAHSDAAATFVHQNRYDTPDDGEDASYTVGFRLSRS